jgi:hypothetical protein
MILLPGLDFWIIGTTSPNAIPCSTNHFFLSPLLSRNTRKTRRIRARGVPKRREFTPRGTRSKINQHHNSLPKFSRQLHRRRQRRPKATGRIKGQGSGCRGASRSARTASACATAVCQRALLPPTVLIIAEAIPPRGVRANVKLPKNKYLAVFRGGGNASHAAGSSWYDHLYIIRWTISTRIFGHGADWVANRCRC